jgi:hypothetical protein
MKSNMTLIASSVDKIISIKSITEISSSATEKANILMKEAIALSFLNKIIEGLTIFLVVIATQGPKLGETK